MSTSNMSNPILAQTIDNLRITDDEYRAKTDECNLLRVQLRESQLQAENLTQLLRRQENVTYSQKDEMSKLQQSLDVVLKELASKKNVIENLQQENARLRRDLGESKLLPSAAAIANGGADSPSGSRVKSAGGGRSGRNTNNGSASNSGDDAKTLSSVYVEQCFSNGVSPHVDIIEGLHKGAAIRVVTEPATFQQLLALCEVLRLKKHDAVMSLQAASITMLEFRCATQDAFRLAAELLTLLPNVSSVTLHGLGDLVAHELACVLAVADNITHIALPDLSVSDEGFQVLFKVISNREQLASQPRPFTPRTPSHASVDAPSASRLLALRDLDLSKAAILDVKSLEAIRSQTIVSLNLSGSTIIKDNILGELIRSCPNLTTLNVSNCAALTNDAVTFVNVSPSITTLYVQGCPNISRIQLFKVKELHSNLARVAFLDVPEATSMPEPITHFQTVSFSAPKVNGLTFSSLAFSSRELSMIAESAKSLQEVAFLNCRLHQGADLFFRQLRKLTHVSQHGCKGITDQDVTCLGASLVSLDLTDQYSLSNKAIKHLGEVCRNLRSITLKRCANISDEGLVALATCADLQYLNVLGMKKLTVIGLHRLITLVPGIQQVVHETIVSVGTQVDRGDVEEAQRGQLVLDQQVLLHAKDTAALAYLNQSPYRLPHPPQSGGQSPPSARKGAAPTAPADSEGAAASGSEVAASPVGAADETFRSNTTGESESAPAAASATTDNDPAAIHLAPHEGGPSDTVAPL